MKLQKNFGWYGLTIVIIVLIGIQYINTHPSKTAAEDPNIKKISNEQEFKSILDNAGSKMLVVDLYADWCGPCRMIQPTVSKLANKYQGKVDFYRVNIDENPQIAAVFKTEVIPYVVFLKSNKVITAFAGIKTAGTYEKIISACASTKEPCGKVIEKL